MIRRLIRLIGLIGLAGAAVASAQYATLTGTLQASNGLPAANYTISFVPNQWGFIAGTGVMVNTTTYCGTDPSGVVVGVTNPLQRTINTPSYSGGTLPAANYFVVFAWATAGGLVTQVSPESTAQLTGSGNLQVAPPAGGVPAGVSAMNVYIGTASGAETYQGQVAAGNVYTQSVPLVVGSNPPLSNTTICKQVANDAIWPVGTGYTVSLTDPSGNTLPGYPMLWQFLGPNTTINLSTGLPYYHGVVTYPSPLLASPQNHATQSVSGGLSLGTYPMLAGSFGVNAVVPGWGLDLEGAGTLGAANAKTGYLFNGLAPLNHLLLGNGSYYVDSATIPATAISPLNYQTVSTLGTPMPQQGILSFDANFVLSNTLGPPGSTGVSLASTVPTVATPTAGHAACIKSAGPPVLIGFCSTQPDASGLCTCN